MTKRTTVELDEDLLARAKSALGHRSTRATIEEALRRATAEAESARDERARRQHTYLDRLGARADIELLRSGEMWR